MIYRYLQLITDIFIFYTIADIYNCIADICKELQISAINFRYLQMWILQLIWNIYNLLWPPDVIGQAIIFLPCSFYLLSFFLSLPNLRRRRLHVCHTSTHDVALVQI